MTDYSRDNWFNPQIRLYILMAISKTREIRCEKCKTYKNIEMHHKKYAPKKVSINDIQLLCSKCHRHTNQKEYSKLKTIFENGRRYCEGVGFRFEY